MSRIFIPSRKVVLVAMAAGAAALVAGWPREERAARALAAEALEVRELRANGDVDGAEIFTASSSAHEASSKDSATREDAAAVALARTDPIAAVNAALGLRPGGVRDEMLRHAASQWAAEDPVAATEWVAGIEEAPLRQPLLEAVATVWAAVDPVAAAEFVASKMPRGASDSRVIAGVVREWARRDPQEAARWVEGFTSGPDGDAARSALIESWNARDQTAAAQWVENSARRAAVR